MKAEIERLRKLVESQAATIKKLESQTIASVPTPQLAPAASALDREALISSLSQWRTEHGVSDPQRYLRNRSTDQLRKMYSQMQEAGPVLPYRLGRRWRSSQ